MKKVITFIFLTFGFSAFGYNAVLHPGYLGLNITQAIFFLMWCPALAAIICTLIFRQKFSALGWRLPNIKWLATAYLIPVGYGLFAYGFIWLSGIAKFDSGRDTDLYQLAVYGILISIAFATGEEIGWRGYLMPNLKQISNSTFASVICGLVWSLWHLPLIVAGLYLYKMPLLPQIILLTISLIGFSLIAEWLRLKSASIWPAVMLHASHNNFLQGYFDLVTIATTKLANYMTGEAGIAMTVAFSLLGVIFWRLIKRMPKENKLCLR